MIELIHSRQGYVEAMNFINSQISNPTPGSHSSIISDIVNALASKDYWMFLQEVYNSGSYIGVVVATEDSKILFIKNGNPSGVSLTPATTETLLLVENAKGLTQFFSAVIDLNSVSTGMKVFEAQIYKTIDRGSDMFNFYIRRDNEVEASGYIHAQVSTDQDLSCYNVKIDKNVVDYIAFKSALGSYTKFQIRVAEDVYEQFSYYEVGQVMYVQNTDLAIADLKYLAKKGVIFYA